MEGATTNKDIHAQGFRESSEENMKKEQLLPLINHYRSLAQTVRTMQKNLMSLILSAKRIDIAIHETAKNLLSQGQDIFKIGQRMDLFEWRLDKRKWRNRRRGTSGFHVHHIKAVNLSTISCPPCTSTSPLCEVDITKILSQPSLNCYNSKSPTQIHLDTSDSKLCSGPIIHYSSSLCNYSDDHKSKSCIDFCLSNSTNPLLNSKNCFLSLFQSVSCTGLKNNRCNTSLNTSKDESKLELGRTISCLEPKSTKKLALSSAQPRTINSSSSVSGKVSSSDIPSEALFSQRCNAKNKKAFIRHFYHFALGKKLLEAAKHRDLHKVERLIADGADADFTTDGMQTLLHRAAATSQADLLALLLNGGANCEITNSYGFRALHFASYYDFSGKCVSLLINAGADLEARNRSGRTPLHYASLNGNDEATRALLAAGADTTVKDWDGKTPFDVAKSNHMRFILCPLRRMKLRSRRRRRSNDTLFHFGLKFR